MSKVSVSLNSLSFSYGDEGGVFDGLTAELQDGMVYSLIGKSGCGKSTLLRLITGLETPRAGEVTLASEKRPAFVFQEPSLMPWATVSENISLPLKISGQNNIQKISKLIDIMGLNGFDNRYPATLSGGQKMRVSIARALAQDADLLLLDEPFAALDEPLRFEMNDLLLDLQRRLGITIIFVTHSIYEAAYLSDRVLVLDKGSISAEITLLHDREKSPLEQRSSHQFADNTAKILSAFGVSHEI